MFNIKRLFKISGGLAIATVLLIVYQNFSGLPDSTKFATKKPMPAQDIDPFSKTDITEQEYAYIALLKTNNLIYSTYIEQANLTKEADYNLNYATKIAVSNSTFIDISERELKLEKINFNILHFLQFDYFQLASAS